MKVKELIEQLQKLDQEKGIWIIYDSHQPIKPEVDEEVIDEKEAEYYRHYEEDVKAGDYTISY